MPLTKPPILQSIDRFICFLVGIAGKGSSERGNIRSLFWCEPTGRSEPCHPDQCKGAWLSPSKTGESDVAYGFTSTTVWRSASAWSMIRFIPALKFATLNCAA